MTELSDGGPAFPHMTADHGGRAGMSLRDWFAGQALAGMRASCPVAESAELAAAAYGDADAMLEARR